MQLSSPSKSQKPRPNKELYEKQLANITDTLMGLAKRRNSDVRSQASRSASRDPAPTSPKRVVHAQPPSLGLEEVKKGPMAVGLPQQGNNGIAVVNDEIQAELDDHAPEKSQTSASDASSMSGTDIILNVEHSNLRNGHSSGRNGTALNKGEDNPRQMLAELERLGRFLKLTPGRGYPPRSASMTDAAPFRSYFEPLCIMNKDDSIVLGQLRANIAALSPRPHRSVSPSLATNDPRSSVAPKSEPNQAAVENRAMETLGKDCVGHAVALQLEANGHDLSRTLGWTSYLFSTGSRSFADQQEQDRVVKRAVEILEQTVKYTWEKEKMYQAAEEKARLPSRIIVENIAADAGIGELVALFGGFHM